MDKLKTMMGLIVDWVLGPKQVLLYQGEVRHDSQTLRATYNGLPDKLIVTSKKIVYKIRYKRKWIPDKEKSIFIVVAEIGDEFKQKFDRRLFIPQTFPLLCNPLLKDTEYPHTFAIHAFLDQFFQHQNKH